MALSCVWKPLRPFLAGPGKAKMEPRWARKATRWAKLGPSWRDLVAKRRQEAPKRATWHHVGTSWPIWRAFLGHLAEKTANQKDFRNIGFSRFWLLWGCPGGGLEASWRSCWPMLVSSSASILHFRAMLGHLGAKMANRTGKMAAKAPRWAKIV